MKQYGFTGKGTGKLGSSIFAISGGEQIVRQYNPVVSNPQTEAQVAQRAKFKLMTQIAASIANILAFRKSGLTSARNKFVSANIENAAMEGNVANVPVTVLKLTDGTKALPEVTASADGSVSLGSAAAGDIDAVVFSAVKSNESNKIEVVDTTIVSTPGAGRTFSGTLTGLAEGMVIFAYGVTYANNSDKVKFNDYMSTVSEDEATLNILQKMTLSNAIFTETKSYQLSNT